MDRIDEASLDRLGRRQLQQYLLKSRLLADDMDLEDDLPLGDRCAKVAVPVMPAVIPHWDLWILRALWPAAGTTDLESLLRARRFWNACLCALPRRLLAGDRELTSAGQALLAGDPSLRAGVVLTLQQGPYPCVLEPFLAAGLTVTVVASERCALRWRPLAVEIGRRLGHRGRIDWLIASTQASEARGRLRQAAKAGGPVVVFADGRHPATAATRAGGASRAIDTLTGYRLPGREIRLSTALARWFCGEELPVHPVSVLWDEDGRGVLWRRQATQRWSRHHGPGAVTQLLNHWTFNEVMTDLAQWSGWSMLVSGILAAAGGTGHAGGSGLTTGEAVPAGWRADFRRAFLLCLDRAAATVAVDLDADLAVWPDDVLADQTHDRFYHASGLLAQELAMLETGNPTLADLSRRFGRVWVENHIQRLCLLGLARLRTVATA